MLTRSNSEWTEVGNSLGWMMQLFFSRSKREDFFPILPKDVPAFILDLRIDLSGISSGPNVRLLKYIKRKAEGEQQRFLTDLETQQRTLGSWVFCHKKCVINVYNIWLKFSKNFAEHFEIFCNTTNVNIILQITLDQNECHMFLELQKFITLKFPFDK